MRSVRFTDAILPGQSSPWPVAGDAAKAKALINFLMQDRFFLEHFRSEDPKVRAAAMETLNKAHHQAYGDAPAADDDAASGGTDAAILGVEGTAPRAAPGRGGRRATCQNKIKI